MYLLDAGGSAGIGRCISGGGMDGGKRSNECIQKQRHHAAVGLAFSEKHFVKRRKVAESDGSDHHDLTGTAMAMMVRRERETGLTRRRAYLST